MAQNEQIVEVVTFTANGLEQMAADAKALADGTADLKAKYGEYADVVEKAARRNELFARAVRDGSYERHVRQVRALNDQYERLRQRADAIARYGPRLGALVDNRAVQAAGRIGLYAGGAALAAGAGLARSGLSGTVEGNRLGLETQLLGREVAGAMKPFTDGITNATMRVRKWMESLSKTQQDMAMYGGLLVAGTVALRAVIGGSAFGALAGGAARGVAGAAATVAAGGAGTALAAAGGAAATRLGGAARFLRRNAKGIGFAALPAALAFEATDAEAERRGERPSDYYARLRAGGRSRAGAAWTTAGRSVAKLFGADDADTTRERMEAGNRRNVTLADAGFESVGSGYDRLSTSLALVDASAAAARESAAGTAAAESTGLIAAMERLAAAFAAAAADPMPRPASGTGGA